MADQNDDAARDERGIVLDESVVPKVLLERYGTDALRATLAALLGEVRANSGRMATVRGLLLDSAVLIDNLLIVTSSSNRDVLNVKLDSRHGSTVVSITIVYSPGSTPRKGRP